VRERKKGNREQRREEEKVCERERVSESERQNERERKAKKGRGGRKGGCLISTVKVREEEGKQRAKEKGRERECVREGE